MRQKILIGLPQRSLNGPTIFAERLVSALCSSGHDARILFTENGCRLIADAFQESDVSANVPWENLPVGANDTWGQRWEALERYLESNGPCFYLMLHDWRNNVVAPRLSSNVKLVGLVQADSPLEIEQAGRLGHCWDAIVAVSEPIQFKVAALYPHLAPRLVTIRNAVPTLPAPPQKSMAGPLRIAYSGELRPNQKRLDDMLEIARRLADRTENFQLTFFGDGAHRGHLERESRDLVSRGLVAFAGRLDPAELLEQLASQHVFLLTSEFEGLSIALLEAMSRGCVPVMSQLASQSIVVRNGDNALTAPVGDIGAFVAHLERLDRDRALLGKLSSAAFQTIAEGGFAIGSMLASYLDLFKKISDQASRGGFFRKRTAMSPPPQTVAGTSIISHDCDQDLAFMKPVPLWPSGPASIRNAGRPSPAWSGRLADCRVIIAASAVTISGVDIFAGHLVKGLRDRGIDARLLGPAPEKAASPLAPPQDCPFETHDPRLENNLISYEARWSIAVAQIEAFAPCVYVPDYDLDWSCICPQLSGKVRVVGIGHSDDPWHYANLCRIGHACDAILGVSSAITGHLRRIAPGFSEKLHTVPYGVELPGKASGILAPPPRTRSPGAPLRIAYTGRLVLHQKRARDLVAIARELDRRGVPFDIGVVGDGELRMEMERAAPDLIIRQKLWFAGPQPNTAVIEFLESRDTYLIPSSFEGLSVGMLEAMSRGVVPVASDIRSGVPDAIVPGENGLVAPLGNVMAFADKLEWLWKNPEAQMRMSTAAARSVAEKFSLDGMVDRYCEIFTRILAEPSKRSCGPFVPPEDIARELTWSGWFNRVASDPLASLQRIGHRFFGPGK